MSEKLKELTERLYTDGVDKARNEAKIILEDAENQRARIVQTAEKEAVAILSKAERESAKLKDKVTAELSMAAQQSEITVKQRMTNLLAGSVLNSGISATIDNQEFFVGLVSAVVKAWESGKPLTDISLVVSEDMRNKIEPALSSALRDLLDKGFTLEFSDRLTHGFRVESREGQYAMSFEQNDFEHFFRSFIKEKTRKILFGRI